MLLSSSFSSQASKLYDALSRPDVLEPRGIALSARRDGDDFLLEGEKRFVVDAERANLLIVAFRTGAAETDLSLAVVDVDAAGVTATGLPTLDLTKRLGTLRFEGVRVAPQAVLGPVGAAWPAIERVLVPRGLKTAGNEVAGIAV